MTYESISKESDFSFCALMKPSSMIYEETQGPSSVKNGAKPLAPC